MPQVGILWQYMHNAIGCISRCSFPCERKEKLASPFCVITLDFFFYVCWLTKKGSKQFFFVSCSAERNIVPWKPAVGGLAV